MAMLPRSGRLLAQVSAVSVQNIGYDTGFSKYWRIASKRGDKSRELVTAV